MSSSRARSSSKATEPASGVDLWQKIKEAAEPAAEDSLEKTCLFVGNKQTGKSTLIASFLNPAKAEEAQKPTVAMDYVYGRRAGAGGGSKRDIAHLFELGGGRLLSDLADVPINRDTVLNSIVIITVDLSQPSTVLSSLLFWISRARRSVDAALLDAQRKDSLALSRFRQQFESRWANHADRSSLTLFPIPLVVVATKFDLFADTEAETRKWMARTLRYVCHSNGASLLYSSNRDKTLLTNFRTLLNHYVFQTAALKQDQKDHAKAIAIVASADTFEAIGPPPASGRGPANAGANNLEAWVTPFNRHFGAVDERGEEIDPFVEEIAKHPEPLVDSMRAQKDEELERYRRESERRERLEGTADGPVSSSGSTSLSTTVRSSSPLSRSSPTPQDTGAAPRKRSSSSSTRTSARPAAS
eukprot:GILJ01002826.1.p1 GENE.GILJ01002826.1~~GILJ01002826.1.p1  ORF type:complete len:415 (-),score=58.49 GILJ01002826.1:190-1434(-)